MCKIVNLKLPEGKLENYFIGQRKVTKMLGFWTMYWRNWLKFRLTKNWQTISSGRHLISRWLSAVLMEGLTLLLRGPILLLIETNVCEGYKAYPNCNKYFYYPIILLSHSEDWQQ